MHLLGMLNIHTDMLMNCDHVIIFAISILLLQLVISDSCVYFHAVKISILFFCLFNFALLNTVFYM